MIGICLMLVLDVSGSIQDHERAIILGGTASALRNPSVVEAFASQSSSISVIAFADNPLVVVPWTELGTADDLHDVAAATESFHGYAGMGTRLGAAMGLVREALGQVECDREVVDVLTDAQAQDGAIVAQEIAQFPEDATINVLQIGNRANIDVQNDLRHGWAGFILGIPRIEEVERATVKKLILEIG